MRRNRWLWIAALALGATPACGDEDGAYEITGTSCVPGYQTACACPGGEQGAQICADDGARYLECVCPPPDPGSCTLFPDCGGCSDCFETCICHSSGDVDGCKATCALGGGAGGGGGGGSGGGPANCVVDQCPAPTNPTLGQFAQKCCTAQNECGLAVSLLGPDCIAGGQEGDPDPDCPSQSLVGTLTLAGCCRPDGKCGVNDTLLGLGCIDISSFTGNQPESC